MVEAWRAGDRDRALAAVPWELLEEVFILGEPPEIRERIGEFVQRGITVPVPMLVTEPDRVVDLIEALGPNAG